MPRVKITDKQKRYDILDECLSCGKLYVDDLAKRLGVSNNTIRNYVDELELEYQIKIRHNTGVKKEMYYYEDPTFSIRKANLSIDEIQRIKESISLLSRLQGTPQFEWMDEVNARFMEKFAQRHKPCISFDDCITKGREHFTPLYNAIINKQVLQLTYHSFTAPEETVTFHPYFLKEYNNRWYIVGLCDDKDSIFNYALDRIKSVSVLPNHTYKGKDININEYYNDVIGVTVSPDNKPVDVIFRLSPTQYQYVKTKKIHHSQVHVKSERDEKGEFTGHIVKIHVALNFELEQLILSFGQNIEIIEPIELREKIKNRLKEALNQYQ